LTEQVVKKCNKKVKKEKEKKCWISSERENNLRRSTLCQVIVDKKPKQKRKMI
jgi:hypothetical protein